MASLTFIIRAQNLNGRLRTNLMSEGGAVRTDTQRRAARVRDRARVLCRERCEESSGRLPASIRYTTAVPHSQESVVAQIGSDLRHALWTEEGTGIYGPRNRRITPTSRTYMLFYGRDVGRMLLTTSILGQPGKHYLRDALEAARG